MDAVAITSAAPAVHQELIRALAERARIHRLRDQQQRRRDQLPGQRQRAPFGAVRRPLTNHDEPIASAGLSVVPLLPDALPHSFGPTDLANPGGSVGPVGLAGPVGSAPPADLAAFHAPAWPA